MARKPSGLPTYLGENPTFVLTTRDLPELKPGQVLVEALYLSNDPAQRTWMSSDLAEKRHYSKPLTFTPCSSERHPCARSRALSGWIVTHLLIPLP
jgi:NADPH-dependent curcumin reductase CurA